MMPMVLHVLVSFCLLLLPGTAPAEVIVVSQASFRTADGAWSPVTLPDSWRARGLMGSHTGHYLLRVTLDHADPTTASWALWTARLSTVRRISVNGTVVVMPVTVGGNAVLARPMPALVEIPPGLLRTGVNQFDVEVHCVTRCGLGAVLFGPSPALLAQHLHHEMRWTTLPQVLNTATVGLALFMLVIWWRRPKEKAIGIFALLWLPTWVRCYSYFVSYPTLSSVAFEAAFFAINIASTALLVLFALELCGQTQPRLRQALWFSSAMAPVLALVCGLLDLTRLVRDVVYPGLLLAVAYTIAMLWREYRAHRSNTLLMLLLSTGSLAGCGAHDVLYIRGWLPIDDFFWMPWVCPLFFVSFSWLLLARLVRALDESEELATGLEKRVAQRTLELQASNAAQVHFIAAASHDLRQPLHTLGLLLVMLRAHLKAPPAVEILSRIDANVEAMDTLLHGILDVSRLNANAEVPQVVAIPLAGIWRNIERSFAAEATRMNLQLRLRPTQLWVASDPHLLQRTLNNLVSNALRYTHAGGVLVAARKRDDRCVIEVWDSGVGIADHRLDDIFTEFVQLDNEGFPPHRGLGLGLAIVRRTAALLGHGLAVHSRLNHGSVFRVTVPKIHVPAAALGAEPAEAIQDVEGLFILTADDSTENLFAMQGLLVSWGCLAVTASSGEEALATLEGRLRMPDALILDYRMPGENGLDLAYTLREKLGMQAPVLIVTGDVSSQPIQVIQQSGHDCLHKPVDPKALRAWLAGVKRSLTEREHAENT